MAVYICQSESPTLSHPPLPFWNLLYKATDLIHGDISGKEPICQCRRHKKTCVRSWVGKIPWSREWLPTPVFLPENSMDREAPWVTVHGVAKNQTRLKWLSTHAQSHSWGLHPHDLITFQRPHLLIPSLWDLGFHHMNFEEIQTLGL